jgi:hypothetical protein
MPTQHFSEFDPEKILLKLGNEIISNKISESFLNPESCDVEVIKHYDVEIEVDGFIVRTDVEYLEEVLTKLHELGHKLG